MALFVRGNVLLLALPPTAAVNWSELSPVRGRCVSAGVKLFEIGTIKRGCAQCFLLFPNCFSLSSWLFLALIRRQAKDVAIERRL